MVRIDVKPLLIASALALLAGCFSKAAGPGEPRPVDAASGANAMSPTNASQNQGLAAPTAPGVSVRITQADKDKTVAVPVGATFAVELVGVPTAGYVWSPTSVPDFMSKVDELGGPTTEAQRSPGFTGGNHWEVTLFTVKGPGKARLEFQQRRPWETNEPANAVFSVTIEAR